ncbi:MAG: hypothetical protein RL199_537 [Pseudomonadota bacterium]|jgi:hypothetical protein
MVAPLAASEGIAWLVHAKFVQLTPFDRVRRDLRGRGIPLAMSALVSFIEHAAELLGPIDGLHRNRLLGAKWMATDGTGLKVLVPELSKAHNGFIEPCRSTEYAVSQDAPDEAREGVFAMLRIFRGTITADAEHRYHAVYVTGSVIEAGCNVHGRRK